MIESYPWGATAFSSPKGPCPPTANLLEARLESRQSQKTSKLLVRWHRDRNYSIGERIRKLSRYRKLTDVEALALKFPLSEAQEIIALEAGYRNWVELKTALAIPPNGTKPAKQATPATAMPEVSSSNVSLPHVRSAKPVINVSNVETSAMFFRDKLGFTIDFLHGQPPFYGSVSRGGACLHLRFVHEPVFKEKIREREQLLSAFLDVDGIKSLFAEFKAAGVHFVQPLKKEPWGASAFIVRDPDGNWICFAG